MQFFSPNAENIQLLSAEYYCKCLIENKINDDHKILLNV